MAVFKDIHHLKYSQNETEYMSHYPVILWVYGGEREGLMNKLKSLSFLAIWAVGQYMTPCTFFTLLIFLLVK